MKDFFTRYRESHKHLYFVPAVFGVLFAFTLVAEYHGTPVRFDAIKANVLEANTPKVSYNADLLLERVGGDLFFRIGKDATNVETLSFSLLGDPSVFQGLTSTDPSVLIVGNEPGVFLVKISLDRSLKAGEIITTMTPKFTGETSIALIDAGFTSRGIVYALSTQGE